MLLDKTRCIRSRLAQGFGLAAQPSFSIVSAMSRAVPICSASGASLARLPQCLTHAGTP